MQVRILLFILSFSIALNSDAQFNLATYLDSLKSTIYLKDYFLKNDNYSDSSYAAYLSSVAPIDTFEIDTNEGFGFKPTRITVTYQKVDYLRFYVGLSKTRNKDKGINELSFHDHNGLKTALTWTFHSNGNIKEIIKYPEESLDTINDFGALKNPTETFSIKQFRKNGSIEFSGDYKNGEKSGNWFYFDKKGILYKKERYEKGKRVSRVSF